MEKESWFVITPDGEERGPYDDFSKAYWAGDLMFGQGGYGVYRRTSS